MSRGWCSRCVACALGIAGVLLCRAAVAAEPIAIKHQGIERAAVLHRPVSAPAAAPLVIALHGLNQSVDGVRAWLGLDKTADREGFVVAYPAAIGLSWSYGRPINQPMPTGPSGATVDDVGFIRLLIDNLIERKIADPKRIYVTGASRGGLMAFTLACALACALADKLAAAAPLITGMTEYQRQDCQPSRPVPIMTIAGTADRMQSFGGAQGLVGRLLSVPETMNFWRQLHGCTGRLERTLPHRDPDDATHVSLLEWSNCRTGTSPRIYRVIGGGHQPPSIAMRASPQSEKNMGLRNRDIESADEVWAFFKSVSR